MSKGTCHALRAENAGRGRQGRTWSRGREGGQGRTVHTSTKLYPNEAQKAKRAQASFTITLVGPLLKELTCILYIMCISLTYPPSFFRDGCWLLTSEILEGRCPRNSNTAPGSKTGDPSKSSWTLHINMCIERERSIHETSGCVYEERIPTNWVFGPLILLSSLCGLFFAVKKQQPIIRRWSM